MSITNFQLKKETITIALIFIFAFTLRSIVLVFINGVDMPLVGDETAYHNIAASLAQGAGFPDNTNRPPFISVVLAVPYFIFGDSIVVARWMMVLISSVVPIVVYFVTKLLTKGRQITAAIAAVIWTIYPIPVYYSSFIYTENLANLICLLVFLFYILASRYNTKWSSMCFGISMGLLTLTRPVFLLFPISICFINIILRYRIANVLSLNKLLVSLCGFIVIMAPWWIRNYEIYNIFVPTQIRSGTTLYVCNGDLNNPAIQAGAYTKPWGDWTGRYKEDKSLLESKSFKNKNIVEQNNILKNLAMTEIANNWIKLPKVLFNRAKNFWTFRPDPYDPNFTRNDLIMVITWIPILIFFFSSFKTFSWTNDWPALLMILYAFIFTLPFWGSPRFRFPVDTFIVIRAILGLYFVRA